jgi:hypothetical protein
MEYEPDNRDKKVAGRGKRKGYVQGKRSYLHALVNSIARRGKPKPPKGK